MKYHSIICVVSLLLASVGTTLTVVSGMTGDTIGSIGGLTCTGFFITLAITSLLKVNSLVTEAIER